MLQAVPDPPDPVIVQVPDIPVLPPWMTLPPEEMVIIAVAFFAACALVLFPLMRAIARRIEGHGPAANRALQAEVEELRERLGGVDTLQHRVADLEERLDFAERLLTQRREAPRLGGGAGDETGGRG